MRCEQYELANLCAAITKEKGEKTGRYSRLPMPMLMMITLADAYNA